MYLQCLLGRKDNTWSDLYLFICEWRMTCSENQISLMESNTRDVICPWASELYSTPQFFGWRLVWMEKWFLSFIRHKNSFSDTNLRWSEHGQTLLGKMRFCWLLRQLVDKTQFISWLWTFTSWLLFKKKKNPSKVNWKS